MTPRQKLIVQSTFERAQPNLAAVGRRLYQKLLERHPGMRKLFASDMSEPQMNRMSICCRWENVAFLVPGYASFAATRM